MQLIGPQSRAGRYREAKILDPTVTDQFVKSQQYTLVLLGYIIIVANNVLPSYDVTTDMLNSTVTFTSVVF
jgi:hypothetical protein